MSDARCRFSYFGSVLCVSRSTVGRRRRQVRQSNTFTETGVGDGSIYGECARIRIIHANALCTWIWWWYSLLEYRIVLNPKPRVTLECVFPGGCVKKHTALCYLSSLSAYMCMYIRLGRCIKLRDSGTEQRRAACGMFYVPETDCFGKLSRAKSSRIKNRFCCSWKTLRKCVLTSFLRATPCTHVYTLRTACE